MGIEGGKEAEMANEDANIMADPSSVSFKSFRIHTYQV
jgi:hypothetical protein